MYHDMDADVTRSLHFCEGLGTCENLQPADEMLDFIMETMFESLRV
jgi:hypothetical protein